MKKVMILGVVAAMMFQAGCASETGPTPTQSSTLIGAGLGTGLGAVLGNNLGDGHNRGQNRAIGMAAGALVGGVIGNQQGKQTEMKQQLNAVQQNQYITTIWLENANGSKTPIQVRQVEGGQYMGPRGEYYPSLPTQEQLRSVYGM
jgi:uncharacterized protein YcfJ